jgi:hypothetical protein
MQAQVREERVPHAVVMRRHKKREREPHAVAMRAQERRRVGSNY